MQVYVDAAKSALIVTAPLLIAIRIITPIPFPAALVIALLLFVFVFGVRLRTTPLEP